MSPWHLLALSFFISWLFSAILVKLSPALLLDRPNQRSLHTRPVPRGGGIGIVVSLWSIALLLAVQGKVAFGLWSLLLAATILALISLIDDLRSLSAAFRLAVQSILSGIWLSLGFWLHRLHLPFGEYMWPTVLGSVFSWLWMLWMTNLYNFMDGMDGFAAGMSIFGFASLAWLGQGDAQFAFLSTSIAVATLGFLYFNFPPARLFLGDVGSTFLGFLAAGLVLYADQQDLFPFWLGIIPFLPFLVDATVTLLRRLWKGEKVWQAHKTHYYQRLVQIGWGHKRTLLWEYLLMAFSSASAIWLSYQKSRWQEIGLIGLMIVYGFILVIVERYVLQGDLRSKSAKSKKPYSL